VTWTYDATSTGFSGSQVNRVRLEIGDTMSTDPLLENEEITYAGTLEGSDLSVSARCCEFIVAKFSRKADMEEGKLSIKLSQRAASYQKKADELRMRDSTTAAPYAGGISIADKESTNADTDRVAPSFFRGMMDNEFADQPSPDDQDVDNDGSN
jgi:hypothetical protein